MLFGKRNANTCHEVITITRIRKAPEVRQTELLDAALELFSSAGYEKTTIMDIVKKAGVAKGTFFYYFPTKEAVLEAICTRGSTELAAAFTIKTCSFSALDKLQVFIEQMFLPNPLDTLLDKLHTEVQFNVLCNLWQQQLENIFNPLLADMIQQGNQEGTIHVDLIKETIVFFWSTLDCLWEAASYTKDPSEVLQNKIHVAESILEKLLGIKEGALKISLP